MEILYESQWLGLYRQGHWEFAKRPNATACVGILAITEDQEILLVEQFRIPVDARVIEIPAGLVGDEDAHRHESLSGSAARELHEETGFRAEKIEPLLASPTSAGMVRETTHLFFATELVADGPGGGVGNEDITVHRIPLTDLRSWLDKQQSQGLMIDFKIHAALWAAKYQY